DAESSGTPEDTLNHMRLMRLEALAASAEKGGLSESQRREAVQLSQELSQLGPGWSKPVYEIAVSQLKDPRQLLGNTVSAEWVAAENLASADKFREAIPAYEAVLRSTDPGARQHATDAHHRLGVCYFRLNRYADAEREFRAYLNAAPQSPLAAEAAYLQFRSAEGIYRDHPTAETRDLFTAAVENYVNNYPRHGSAYEGQFRWGEILQGERKFAEATDAFARVKGPPAFEVRAAANELQCLADVLTNAPKDAQKPWADGVRTRAAKAYDRF